MATQIQSDEGRQLLKQIESLEDSIISQKKMLADILYNLDSDNVPELRKVSRLVSENGKQMSEIIQEVDSITLRVSKVEDDVDGLPSTIESVISAEINDTGGIIKAYVEGKNYLTQPDADGIYTKISNLNSGIRAYINTQEGITELESAVSATYQRIDQMGNYLLNADLYSGVKSYINTQEGITQLTSAVSGTYQTKAGMNDYATTQNVAAIEQTVTQHGSQIALVVGSGRLVDSSGNANGSIVINAINGAGSQALISFDKINITGVTTFLKASDVGAGGSTVIDGGRVSASTLSSSKITRVGSYIDLADMTAVHSTLVVGYASSSNFTQFYHQSQGNFVLSNANGSIEFRANTNLTSWGYAILTTQNLVAQ